MEGVEVLKIDPAFLFELSSAMRKVREVETSTQAGWAAFSLDYAKQEIERAISQSVYAHLVGNPARIAATSLFAQIDAMCGQVENDELESGLFTPYDVSRLSNNYAKFETLFLGDLQRGAIYLVSPQGGFDTDTLIEVGQRLFSTDLEEKVPAATADLVQATRCIAFQLPTAAGFHLHRAHESVLRVYWDCVTGGADRPKENNMGVYLRELDKLKKGREEVRSHLRSIKDFHRNPLMHPEQSLENVDQALDLLAAIRCSIGYMLQEIPGAAAPLLQRMSAAE